MLNLRKPELWFKHICGTPSADFRLFWFPCAGASFTSYSEWAMDLPPSIEGFAVRMPGRSDRFHDEPVTDLRQLVEEMAVAVRPLLNRPFIFFGHSFGALSSFELIRELRYRHTALPVRLFVAGRAAPQVPHKDPPIHHLSDGEFVARLNASGGIPREVIEQRELLDVVLPAMRADVQINESYRYRVEEPLICPITACGGTEDEEVTVEDLQAWQGQTSSDFDIQMFGGGHFFVYSQRRAIIRAIVEKLQRC